MPYFICFLISASIYIEKSIIDDKMNACLVQGEILNEVWCWKHYVRLRPFTGTLCSIGSIVVTLCLVVDILFSHVSVYTGTMDSSTQGELCLSFYNASDVSCYICFTVSLDSSVSMAMPVLLSLLVICV